MSLISRFFEENYILVYFFYGLAFFTMGLAILLESRRSSQFRLAQALLPLGGFGILHGLHEWFEMFELVDAAGATNIPGWLLLEPIRLGHLVISFALLIVFGVRLIFANRRSEAQGILLSYAAAVALVVLWFVAWEVTIAVADVRGAESRAVADVLARYMLGIPGSLLAAWAIFLEQQELRRRAMPQFGRALLWSAAFLFVYGVLGQIFTRPSFLFPSNVINSAAFLEATGIPVQFFRALLATGMAITIIRALHVFEIEGRQRLAEAQSERLVAQAEALAIQQEAHRTTERLNDELQLAVRNLSSLHTFARDLSATLDEEVLLRDVFPRFIYSEPRVGAGMIMLRSNGQALEIAAKTICHAREEDALLMEQAAHDVGERVIETGLPSFWNEREIRTITSDDDQPWPSVESNVRVVGIPLLTQDVQIGAMLTCVYPGLLPFAPPDFALFSTAARQMSAALQNARLYGEAQRREHMRAQLLGQVVTAQEQERQRIARELHDGPGQTLTGLGLGVAATIARFESDPTAAGQQLGKLKDLSAGALQELREIIADLRPSVLDDLGLLPALRSQIQLLEERSQVKAQLTVTGPRRRLPAEVETIVFRIVQEALTNIVKHATARTVTVQLTFAPAAVEIMIRDDGKGFDVKRMLALQENRLQGWGMLGMQERAALVGGTCQVESEPGSGTTIHVHIPLSLTNGDPHG